MNDTPGPNTTNRADQCWPWSPDETRGEQVARLRQTATEYAMRGWRRDAAMNAKLADYYEGLLNDPA